MGEKRSVSRNERIPLTGMRKKLEVPAKYKRPGYVQHWFNDDLGRLQEAENAWWSFVTRTDIQVGEGEDRKDQLSTKVRTIVGKNEDGSPKFAYLMEIQEKFYKEDEAARDKNLDEIDRAIRRGEGPGGAPGEDGKYIPPQGIKYENKLE